jgi:hypothetical protein
MHGHQFQVVYRGDTNTPFWDGSQPVSQIPVRRDVIMVNTNASAVWRFQATNPGVYLIHWFVLLSHPIPPPPLHPPTSPFSRSHSSTLFSSLRPDQRAHSQPQTKTAPIQPTNKNQQPHRMARRSRPDRHPARSSRPPPKHPHHPSQPSKRLQPRWRSNLRECGREFGLSVVESNRRSDGAFEV